MISLMVTFITLSLFFFFFRKIDVTLGISTRSSPRWRLSWHQPINSSSWIWTKMNSKASPTPTLSLLSRFNTKQTVLLPRKYYFVPVHLDCPLSSLKKAQTQQDQAEPNQDYTQFFNQGLRNSWYWIRQRRENGYKRVYS